jgi:hypothetical protein
MKRAHSWTVALLALPAALAAQSPATPPAAAPNGIVASFKMAGGRYGNLLAQAFDSIPASKYGFKPTPIQQTVGYIAQHLEDANYQLCAPMTGQTHTRTAKDSLADTVKAMWPKDTLVARLRASLAFCDNAMNGITDAQLTEDLTVGPASSPRKIMRSRYFIGFVTDLAEHYAQLASYMRIMGLVPPTALPRPSR